jgi:hypothetical protein
LLSDRLVAVAFSAIHLTSIFPDGDIVVTQPREEATSHLMNAQIQRTRHAAIPLSEIADPARKFVATSRVRPPSSYPSLTPITSV